MNSNANLAIAIIGCVIGILGFVCAVITLSTSQKRNNVDDGQKFGEFMGEIRTDIRNIKDDINEIKKDRRDMQNAINRAIEQHEERYHRSED